MKKMATPPAILETQLHLLLNNKKSRTIYSLETPATSPFWKETAQTIICSFHTQLLKFTSLIGIFNEENGNATSSFSFTQLKVQSEL